MLLRSLSLGHESEYREMTKTYDNSEWFWAKMRCWFEECGRDLPWRHDPSPYEVWVSEIMLQQTQVVTVIPYYERWMARFPDIRALAEASLDEVLQHWAGLGYYRRAGYLHKGAQFIIQKHHGEFPQNVTELRKIPGIGPYTAGAIASFAFGQNEPAIDGNVERVLARFFGIRGDLSTGDPRRNLEDVAGVLANHGDCRIINQAMMDLGASFCGKSAHCEQCPVAEKCFALRHGLTESLPQKKVPVEKYDEYRAALRMKAPDGRIWIGKRRENMLLGGLWEFPMIEISRGKGARHRKSADQEMRLPRDKRWEQWLRSLNWQNDTPTLLNWTNTGQIVSHTFTHIQMRVHVDEAFIEECVLPESGDDVYERFVLAEPQEIGENYAISTLMRKILDSLIL
jgi:A/G-specific adenine glycosylase